ncbi:tetratricopeptide repeat protein 21B-like [Artemia franciscana]|uniref:tetratricopeptide repeat protein 21B-like n=1 Tax=Artemia franciscana TaxID=6661 RepID=UPI0032DBC7D3
MSNHHCNYDYQIMCLFSFVAVDDEATLSWSKKKHYFCVSNISKMIETLILLRNGFYVSVIRETEDTKNELLILIRGVAFSMLQRNEEARKAFQFLISVNEYKLCGLIGWIHVNQSSANEKMKKRLKDEIKSANVQGFTNAAFYYYITEKYEKALEFSEKACRLDLEYQREETWMVYASVKFATNASEDALSVIEHFPRRDSVFSDLITVEFASFLGHTDATYDNLLKKYPAAENILVEKAKFLFLLDPRRDVLELFSKIPDDNLYALYLRSFIALITSGDVKQTIEIISRILNAMEEEESENHSLFLETVELFASVNEKEEVTHHLLERIKTWKISSSTAYHFSALELELHLFLKEYDRAEEILKDDCVKDSLEIVFCSARLNLLQGRLDEAAHLLAYIDERINLDPPSFFFYLKAFYSMLIGKTDEGNNLLEQALLNHLSGLEIQTNLINFYIDLDGYRLLEMISIYFEFSAKEPYEKGEIVDPLTVVAGASGKMLAQHLPHHKLAQLYWARLCFILGDLSSSIVTARNITENIDNQCVEAYLLEARSFIVTEDYMAAKRCLENCLSYNFSVRSMPEYHFILGSIQRRQGDISSALKTLQLAQKMMAENDQSGETMKELKSNSNIFQSYDIELEICKTMSGLGQEEEAIKRLEIAISNCSDVERSNYFLFSWVDIMLISGNSEAAIEALQRIPASSRYFIRSRKYLANIALEKFSDKTTYIACFREIVTVSPVSENWLLLGNAYMSLQMPEKAIEVSFNQCECLYSLVDTYTNGFLSTLISINLLESSLFVALYHLWLFLSILRRLNFRI